MDSTQGSCIAMSKPTTVNPALDTSDDLLEDTDEPPDEPYKLTPRHTCEFTKIGRQSCQRKESLLTQAFHTSAPASEAEQHGLGLKRGLSTQSTCSTASAVSMAELTSDGGLTSPGTRTSSPSPTLPPVDFHPFPYSFHQKPAARAVTIRHDEDQVAPHQKSPTDIPDETALEANLGRKRCITFACGRKSSPARNLTPSPAKTETEKKPDPPKRRCLIQFACTAKPATEKTAGEECKSGSVRQSSPPPPARKSLPSPKPTPRSHRDSDSTVRNESPKTSRKVAPISRSRKFSQDSDVGRSEATRFHEFASSEEEVDEWVQESTCHRSRLTINDTLKLENGLRQLAEEVEEEAMEDGDEDDDEEEEANEEDDDIEDDEASDEDEEGEIKGLGLDHRIDYSSDEGFQTDDEEGFAGSDDESDAGSDYAWWAPTRSTAATSYEPLEHIRPVARRSLSNSSIGSVDSASSAKLQSTGIDSSRRKSKPVNVRPRSPELPDSTDFVCGTLDEDRPLEAAYMTCIEKRRAAKHKAVPQDIDPTFPASDPEMDEEDEDDEIVEESDQHLFMHGQLDPHDDIDPRGRQSADPKRRSPLGSPRHLRSPAPLSRRTTSHRSPPPTVKRVSSHRSPPPAVKRVSSHRSPPPPVKRVSSHRSPPPIKRVSSLRSPPPAVKRMSSHRSPPPPIRRSASHRSPPPSRSIHSPPPRKLFAHSPTRHRSPPPVRLRSPPPSRRSSYIGPLDSIRETTPIPFACPRIPQTSSLPRTPMTPFADRFDDQDEETVENTQLTRRAIDIKEGLECKRQHRKEKLYQKHCKKSGHRPPPPPGKGAERMREMGIELAAYKSGMGKQMGFNIITDTPHMMSV